MRLVIEMSRALSVRETMLCRHVRELSKYTADSSRQRSYPSDYLNYFYIIGL